MGKGFRPPALLPALLASLTGAGLAQQGDLPGEEQPPPPETLVIPPAPVRTPEEALALFELPPGLSIELVAAEPLVEDPVQAVFDERGRLWVTEMRGYMPNVDGTGELEPVGVIAVLEDTLGDGRMDRRTEFLSGLVLPRGVAPVAGGALVLAPPRLLLVLDTDGDGRGDRTSVIDGGLAGLDNPEHAVNGLLLGLDNAYWCANHAWRYVREGGTFARLPTAGGGQWGIAQDDLGRIFFNTNSEPLRGDRYASWYAVRNPNHGHAAGVNERIVHDLSVAPSRVTPGVNRGYREGELKGGVLASYTAACGPLVYRGDLLGREHAGDAFVCEPAANLVARYALAEDASGRLSGVPRRQRFDFLTSTDERFRPVNLLDGPDGALYVVDFYRGLIQHRLFKTTFLRRQVLERGLDGPVGLGRIWRVVPDRGRGRGPRGAVGERLHGDVGERLHGDDVSEHLLDASWEQLAALLGHGNGWWRSQAQRMFVEDGAGSRAARRALEGALVAEQPLSRVHALWALSGAGLLSRAHVERGLADADARVRHEALRVAEPLLSTGDGGLTELAREVGRAPGRLRQQALLSLGQAATEAGDAALLELLALDSRTPELRSAVLSGLFQRELSFLELLLAGEGWRGEREGRADFVRLLARCIAREGRTEGLERALEAAVLPARPAWQRAAILAGIVEGRPPGPGGDPAPILLARAPASWDALGDDAPARAARAALAWPGKPGYEVQEVVALTPEEQARFEHGRALYAVHCAACHLPCGRGDAGKAPPLRHARAVLGPPQRSIRVVTGGLVGPIEAGGLTFDLEMPAHALSSAEVAAVLTYVRREWGHGASPVTAEAVERVRDELPRAGPWTAAELDALDSPPEVHRDGG